MESAWAFFLPRRPAIFVVRTFRFSAERGILLLRRRVSTMLARPAVCGLLLVAGVGAAELPGRYYRLMEAGLSQVSTRLKAEPSADLETLEVKAGWRHFPSALLVAAVLYSSPH